MTERIERVEGWLCPLPMPYELHLGAITYRTRDYVILRVTSTSGHVGAAIGYSRGTPLLTSLEMLARDATAFEGDVPADVSRTLRRRYAPGWGSMVRAASLLDIALWDIAARRQGVPVSKLFADEDRDIPLMAVAGYFLDQRGGSAILDEVSEFVESGYQAIKLIVPGHDLAADLRLVEDVTARLPDSVALGIDFHGAFTSVDEAVNYCSAFESFRLRFIEDLFPSYEIGAVSAAAARVHSPIAAGEDVMTASVYDLLVAGGVRYLRADVTASGGYTDVLPAAGRAGSAGAHVAPHVWPHMHYPLAMSHPGVTAIELIPHSTGADPIDELLAEPFPVRAGKWVSPPTPGLYLPLDWSAVARTATASFSTSR